MNKVMDIYTFKILNAKSKEGKKKKKRKPQQEKSKLFYMNLGSFRLTSP